MKTQFLMMHIMCISMFAQAQVSLQTPMSNLNAGFIENAGQFTNQGKANEESRYISQNENFYLSLNPDGFTYNLFIQEPSSLSEADLNNTVGEEDEVRDFKFQSSQISVKLIGANRKIEMIAEDPMPGVLNYYTGQDVNHPITNVKRYSKIIYRNVYDGIDLEFAYREQYRYSPLEYSFIVHPGADPSNIKMKYEGSRFMTVNAAGDLTVGTSLGEISERGLYSFEHRTGKQVSCQYKIHSDHSVGFQIDKNPENTIIIDPEIVWGTYYGGKGSEDWDTESEISVDQNKNVIVCGSTTSLNMSTDGTTPQGDQDMFLAKFDEDGKTLVFATYIGGLYKDVAYAIALDASDNIILGGLTLSTGLATTGCFQYNKNGKSDAWIGKFSATGLLSWATYFGGPGDTESEHVRSLEIMPNGEFYACGYITSAGIGTDGVHQKDYAGGGDAFLSKFNASGFRQWATYLGSTGCDRAHTLKVDGSYVYITGTASSKTGMSTAGAHQPAGAGGTDAYLAKFLASSGTIVWSTYYGGTFPEHGRGVVVDDLGYVYINGWTRSNNNISTEGSFMEEKFPPSPNGSINDDGYIAKFTSGGARIWGTYFGGEANEYIFNLIQDEEYNLYFCGKTGSKTGIATPDAFQAVKNESVDGFIGRMDRDGNLQWCTYFGGTGIEQIFDMDFDADGFFYFNLATTGSITTTAGVYKETFTGGSDIAIYKMSLDPGCSDNFESNDTQETAAKIIASNNLICYGVIGKIESVSDEDWFKVILTSDKPNLQLALLDISVPMNIELYNANGNLLATTTGTFAENPVIAYSSSIGATYTIHVVHGTDITSTNGCYRLQALKSKTPFAAKIEGMDTFVDGINISENEASLELFPNPAVNEVKLRFYALSNGTIQQLITDAMGRQVMVTSNDVSAGVNEWKVDVSRLPAGIYQITCVNQLHSVSQSLMIAR